MALFVIFLAIPLIEIALFVTVGQWLTLWPTLGLVVLTGIVGTAIVRYQGLKVLADVQRSMQDLGDPVSPLAHGALILMAGFLLITPGFFTDTLGFLLLIPPLRRWLIRRIAAHVTLVTPAGRPQPTDDTTIEGEYIDLDAVRNRHRVP